MDYTVDHRCLSLSLWFFLIFSSTVIHSLITFFILHYLLYRKFSHFSPFGIIVNTHIIFWITNSLLAKNIWSFQFHYFSSFFHHPKRTALIETVLFFNVSTTNFKRITQLISNVFFHRILFSTIHYYKFFFPSISFYI